MSESDNSQWHKIESKEAIARSRRRGGGRGCGLQALLLRLLDRGRGLAGRLGGLRWRRDGRRRQRVGSTAGRCRHRKGANVAARLALNAERTPLRGSPTRMLALCHARVETGREWHEARAAAALARTRRQRRLAAVSCTPVEAEQQHAPEVGSRRVLGSGCVQIGQSSCAYGRRRHALAHFGAPCRVSSGTRDLDRF